MNKTEEGQIVLPESDIDSDEPENERRQRRSKTEAMTRMEGLFDEESCDDDEE